jgi:hypothetical protein
MTVKKITGYPKKYQAVGLPGKEYGTTKTDMNDLHQRRNVKASESRDTMKYTPCIR